MLEPPPTVAKTSRKNPDEMIVIVEDLIKLLDGLSASYRRGRHPDSTRRSSSWRRSTAPPDWIGSSPTPSFA